ncbi:alpha/beta hydrolase [Nonomuraea soli]|uniref:Acetyl esterase/lipase n=1 Tax=Nonomuraea soli TaxID=1032476 RepID=A0A7W0HUE5_9ACTN|nr:alpha/beta hydrolase [Nonomuraea soli]MBA2895882.1 acetyl esterase/lipase [Nonomuraea soli]
MRPAVTLAALALAALVPAAAHATSATAAAASTLSSASVNAAAASTLSSTSARAAKDPTPEPTVHTTTDPFGVGGFAFETISYGPHKRQAMDVWWTPDGMKRPGIFLIHGGWWSSGDKTQATSIARSYAELGYTVFNLNYRLSGDAAWPSQRSDVFDAIHTGVKSAERWQFDPKKYVILGFSAGGHLATAVGTFGDGELPGLKGVVGVSPVVSPLLAFHDGDETFDPNRRKLREAAVQLAGGCEPLGKCSRVWASMEVQWHASRGDAPVLTVHSQDEFVPPSHSVRLKSMLGQVGVPMTVLTVPGIAHSSPLYRTPGVAERIQKWIIEKIG